MANTTPNNFAKDVVELMKKYTTDVEDAIEEEVVGLGEIGARKLQNTLLPSATSSGTAIPSTRREWKKYAKGWTTKVQSTSHYASSTIHNKKYWQLTHLLEDGHYTRDKKTITRGFKHITPVEEELDKELLENVKKIVKKGGKL